MKKINKVLFAILAVAMITTFGVSKSEAQVTDKDGNAYKTVTIGNQEWMSENLNVSHYRNGDPIPEVEDSIEWSKATTGEWCFYDNDSKNGKTYGKLYNWYAVNDPRGLAPEGWHVPSDAEWTILIDYLGGKKIAGGKLKAVTLWQSPNDGATNESGFTGLPGGVNYCNGYFRHIGKYVCFWSSSEEDSDNAWLRDLYYAITNVGRSSDNKRLGLTVRCLKD